MMVHVYVMSAFSKDNKVIDSFTLENELDLFGGFYNGEENYYLFS